MSGSNFDLIAQEVLKQKQVMEQMEEENQELRRQLADLREGQSIFVEIYGKRFSLFHEHTTPSEVTAVEAMAVATVVVEPEPQAEPHDITQDETEELVMSIPKMSRPTVKLFTYTEETEEQTTGPTFLEEVMIDEFASAATSPLAVWSAPKQEQEKKPAKTTDEELAALRHQLIGSYLLE